MRKSIVLFVLLCAVFLTACGGTDGSYKNCDTEYHEDYIITKRTGEVIEFHGDCYSSLDDGGIYVACKEYQTRYRDNGAMWCEPVIKFKAVVDMIEIIEK